MIVEQIRLRGWRSHREPLELRFSEQLNLIVGPNEAGKSSLFEALQRALFDRHTSKTRELQEVQPLGSSLGPEVELLFRVKGRRYRLRKRFLVDPISELQSERGGVFELDHEGDRADARLRELFGGRPASRGSKARHRGLAQALWYLQRESGLPAKSWGDAVHESLTDLIRTVLRTPLEERVTKRLLDVRHRTLTAVGAPRAGSELAELGREVAELEREVATRGEELRRGEAHRRELEKLQAELEEVTARLERAEEERTELQREKDSWAGLDQEREARERRLAELVSSRESINRVADAVRRCQEELGELERRLEKTEERTSELQIEVRHQRRAAESHARRWEGTLEPRLKGVVAQLEQLRAKLRLDDLEREAERLAGWSRRRQEVARRLERAERELRKLAAPDKEEASQLEALAAELELLRARAQAAAVRVAFELASEAEVEAAPETERDGEEFLVTEPTAFEIAGVGRVRVRSGDEALERSTLR